ncbi:tyrosine-type recombinase/integrase [Curtobacterium sp. MCLR17_032]|uniref:tyrosine-type recombinase/integrase n=1 Tax=Curtobacterium sp. MCLR17_032 TaxID=2175650 RepID=UPI000DA8C31C|nr:tyrosine-type recombinase/integrase [Curtobacterium sp. MCLR17_032]WIE62680.1 tyrosine-type recombinase/integrase [Curtobacterium sp. MCLR17_032]
MIKNTTETPTSRSSRPKPHARPINSSTAKKIDDAIENYVPIINRAAYATTGPLVREVVRAMAPTSYSNTRRLLSMVAGLVSWRWMHTGCDLTAERVFRDSTISLYVNTVLQSHSDVYRFDITRHLGAVTTRLTGERTSRLAPPPSQRLAPYTSAEMAQLHSWQIALSTAQARRNGAALLALGAGAGLTPAEIIAVRTSDIVVDGDRRWVTVRGASERSVPVSAKWIRTLGQALTTDEDLLFHGYEFEEYAPRPIQSFISAHPGPVRLTPTRLRSGWIVSLLNANVPLDVIAEVAGFTALASVTDYYAHASSTNINDYLDTITGVAGATR